MKYSDVLKYMNWVKTPQTLKCNYVNIYHVWNAPFLSVSCELKSQKDCISWKAMWSQKGDGKLGKLCYSCLRKDIAQPGGMEVFGFLTPFKNHLEIFLGVTGFVTFPPQESQTLLPKLRKKKLRRSQKRHVWCCRLKQKNKIGNTCRKEATSFVWASGGAWRAVAIFSCEGLLQVGKKYSLSGCCRCKF